MADGIRDFASETAHKVEEVFSGVKERAERLKQTSFEDIWSKSLDYAKANPGKAILISAALGFLLGGFLRRRD